jgi:uncharacterized protein (DUF58 family)
MIPKEILKKVRKIEIRTKRLVNDVFAGEYHSVFQGRGMEFAEVREYQPGDDIRSIDWNVTARMGEPYVKRFQEERELTVMFLIDASASGDFGTANPMENGESPKTKRDLAAEICALLAFSAINNNDKVGLIFFTDHVEKYVPPKKGRQHVLRVIREVLYFEPQGKGSNIKSALEFFSKVTNRRATAFLISDFMDAGYEKALRVANRKHDCVAIRITDPRELKLPNVGFVELEDAETGELMLVDTSDKQFRERYATQNFLRMEETQQQFRKMKVDQIDIFTDKSYVEPLMKFFKLRERRFR